MKSFRSIVVFLALLVPLFSWAQNAVLDSISIVNGRNKTLEASLNELQHLHNGKVKSNDGKLYFTAPESLSILFNSGDKVVVASGKVLFDHGMFHNTFNPAHNALMNNVRCLLLYSVQGKCQQLADECGYILSTKQTHDEYVVTLTSKKKKMLGLNLVVLHYSRQYQIVKIEYTASNDDHSVYTLSNVKCNKSIGKEVFSLE